MLPGEVEVREALNVLGHEVLHGGPEAHGVLVGPRGTAAGLDRMGASSVPVVPGLRISRLLGLGALVRSGRLVGPEPLHVPTVRAQDPPRACGTIVKVL